MAYALSRSFSLQRSFFCGDVIEITSWVPDVANLVRPVNKLTEIFDIKGTFEG